MLKGTILQMARGLGLMHAIDNWRYRALKIKNAEKNKTFKAKHPEVILPPDYVMYESFRLDYEKYYAGGKEVAEWISSLIAKHAKTRGLSILDWGCGPARVLRHMNNSGLEDCKLFGADYNEGTIDWCQGNLKDISFSKNGLYPPLVHQDQSFDAIYGISVFTHLSEKAQKEWLKELLRVSKDQGIIILTTQGDAFKSIMALNELKQYEQDELVERKQVKEGHRVYSAFASPKYMRRLFEEVASVIEFIPGKMSDSGNPEQDVWILRV